MKRQWQSWVKGHRSGNLRVAVAMVSLLEVSSLLLVAALWGITNPFLKKGTEGIEKIEKRNRVVQLFYEIKFLFLNYKCLIPFLLNQSGSVVYYLTLRSAGAVLGMLLTVGGTALCVASSLSEGS
ncbi:transmembrane protein 234 isoform X2 [Protopterus annectens]|uniref:transmembrane protein 234 isoform X2 n=1 Tax=Protopterus annectens TaxID=7888 RepID=UPI001CF9E9AF|nr:transmembrane protein 234 isoform X2 [Protopterus annectens]